MTPADPSDPRHRELGWIHLTDLHAGQPKEGGRVPEIEAPLIDDLRRMVAGGPGRPPLWIDVVFFTGDIAFKGIAEEFGQATALLGRVLGAIRRMNAAAGAPEPRHTPLLVPVPGNHDLARPSRAIAGQIRAAFAERTDNAPALWTGPTQPVQPLVEACFADYMAWLKHPLPFPRKMSEGIVPGDMACTINRGGVRLGVVGLNSAYLHLDDAGEGTQHIDRSQFERLVGSGHSFAERHDVTVLMTHHPPESLSDTGRAVLSQGILRTIDLHLYGHAHVGRHVTTPGAYGIRHGLQGRSLFGAEEDGFGRLHGYSAGRVRVTTADGEHTEPVLETWTRPGWLAGNTWVFGPVYATAGEWRARIDLAPRTPPPSSPPDTPGVLPEGVGDHQRLPTWPAFEDVPARVPAGTRKTWLFLSASIPGDSADRAVKPGDMPYVRTARPKAIEQTLVALARKLAASDTGLLFAGAPSVTRRLAPVLLEAHESAPWVILLQAEWFQDRLIEEVPVVAALDDVICARWQAGADEDDILGQMRKALAGFPGLVGSVYIGGKGGIKDEFDAFGDTCPDRPRLALGLGGGAAAELLLDPKTEAAAHGAVTTGDHPRGALPRPGRLWHTPEAAVDAICEHFAIE